MDYNKLTEEFGGTITKAGVPTGITAKDLSTEFGGSVGSSSDIYFGNTYFAGGLSGKLLSNEKALGETLGQSLAVNSKDFTALEQSRQGLNDMQVSVIKEIQRKKSIGEDTTRLENVLAKTQKAKVPSIQEIAPATTKTTKQALGEVGGVGLDLLSAGTLKPAASAVGLTKALSTASKLEKAGVALSTFERLKKAGLSTLKLLGVATPIGYGYDVTQGLQEGEDTTEALKPGYGTLFSTVIPLASGGIQATKALARPTADYLIGNLSGKGVAAAKQFSRGGQDFAGITPTEVLQDTRKSLSLYDNTVKNNFGAAKKEMIDKFTGQRIGLDQTNSTKIRQIAGEFGFGDKLPQNLANMSVKESMDLISEINSAGRTKISPLDTPIVRTQKYELSQLKDVVKQKAIKEFGGDGGQFEKVYQEYSKAQRVIDDMENVVGTVSKFKTLTPTALNTAYSRLQRIFNQDSTAYINAIKSFESVTGERILDKVAASQFSDLVPKALKQGDNAISAIVNDVFSLVTFPLRSPKIGGKLLSVASGYKPNIIEKLLNSSPAIKQGIYDMVIKENMSLDEAITTTIEQFNKTPNKQGGFVRLMKDASKSVRPDAVAKLVDSEDVAILKDFVSKNDIESYIKAQPILDAMKIGVLNEAEQKRFVQEVLDIQNPAKSLKVTQAKTTQDNKIIPTTNSPKAPTNVPKSANMSGNIAQTTSKVDSKQPRDLIGRFDVKPKPTVPVYQGEKDLTLKTLEKLKGRSTVSKQFISDLTNSADLKQSERDLIREALATEKGDTINVTDFAKKVKTELLPLTVETSDKAASITSGRDAFRPKYENISLPDELRGKVKDYRENIYQSPIKTSASDVHFSGRTDNYFGHTRIEDMANNKTRRVIEVQSDLYQKGNLEKEIPRPLYDKNSVLYDENQKYGTLGGKATEIAPRAKEVAKLQQYNDPTAHFRMIREEVKKAAQDGKTKLQFPTGETAMKIEGLGETSQWRELYENIETPGGSRPSGSRKLKPENLEVGMRIGQEQPDFGGGMSIDSEWIITDVLGDGKFKAVPKHIYDESYADKELVDYAKTIEANKESFDISGKVDTNNPIYKFYEKEVGRYLSNKYKAKLVTDAQGVKWWEVDINHAMGKAPVEAFGIVAGATGLTAFDKMQKANNKK